MDSKNRPRWISLRKQGGIVAAALLMLGFVSRADARTSDLRLVITSSPNPVVQGARVTWTLVVTNHGPDDAHDVTVAVHLPYELHPPFVNRTPAPGWTVTSDVGAGGCFFGSCSSATYAAFRTPTLPSQTSAVLSVVQEVLHPPGAMVELAAYVTTLPPTAFPRPELPIIRGAVLVEGSGPLPSATSRAVPPVLATLSSRGPDRHPAAAISCSPAR